MKKRRRFLTSGFANRQSETHLCRKPLPQIAIIARSEWQTHRQFVGTGRVGRGRNRDSGCCNCSRKASVKLVWRWEARAHDGGTKFRLDASRANRGAWTKRLLNLVEDGPTVERAPTASLPEHAQRFHSLVRLCLQRGAGCAGSHVGLCIGA